MKAIDKCIVWETIEVSSSSTEGGNGNSNTATSNNTNNPGPIGASPLPSATTDGTRGSSIASGGTIPSAGTAGSAACKEGY